MLKGAIIGFGGLGSAHFREFEKLSDMAEIVAICDVDASRFETAVETNISNGAEKADLSAYRLYTDAYEMLEKETLDFVVTAIPTYRHAEIAIAALNKGIHVLSEKPMARTVEECQMMIDVAKKNGKLLSIGQCMRFSKVYQKLKELVDSKEYGELIRLDMQRLSPPPVWGWKNWFMDFSKSGGAALDLHVHDVDFMQYMLGMPLSLTSETKQRKWLFDNITTSYQYANGAEVRIVGDWSLSSSFAFRAEYFAVFERGVCYAKDGKVYLCPDDGERVEVEFEADEMYVEEKRYFFECIEQNKPNDLIAPESAMRSIEIVMKEMESATTGQTIIFE